jgi:RHS repeat-associated protein
VVKDPTQLSLHPNRVTYTGHYLDPEVGLYYARARYLDPALGAFTTQDAYLGAVIDPRSLHRLSYAYANPTGNVDPDGHSVRRAWNIDGPDTFWSSFGKNVAYNTWNLVSFGTLGRQDALVEKNLRGEISDEEYWKRTGVNAVSGLAIAGATAATGGLAGGLVGGLGASATTVALTTGVGAGLGGQAATDVIEVFGTGTKRAEDVRALDYAIAGGFGLAGGALGARIAANPGAVRFNLNPNMPGLGMLDDTIIQRSAQAIESGLGAVGRGSFGAGRQAGDFLSRVEVGFDPNVVSMFGGGQVKLGLKPAVPNRGPIPSDPDFIGPVRQVTDWQGYEAQVAQQYGGRSAFSSRSYKVNLDGRLQGGVADNVASVGGLDVAVEAKFGGTWARSIRNPRSPVALGAKSRAFAKAERLKLVNQARRHSAAFDEVHYHTTMPELADYYSRLFGKIGLDNVSFFHTPPTVY